MNRLVCLDGLRGLLAVYVMASHMAPFAALPGWVQSALSHGGAAVDLFFTLSGLVIMGSLAGVSWQARPFLIARAFRIFPAYLPVLALAIVVQSLPNGFERMPWIAPDSPARSIWSDGWPPAWAAEIAAHLTMTHGLFPAAVLPDVWVSFLGAAWSLSTEWQFYVLALLAGHARPVWHQARSFGIHGQAGPSIGTTAPRVGALAAGFLALSVAGVTWQVLAPPGWQFSRAFLPNKAQYFALGIASAGLVDRRAWRPYLIVLGATLALCSLGGPEKLLPPLAWTVCLSAALGVPGLRLLHRMLSARIMVWFGALSYPIYLVNEPVQKPLGGLLARVAAGDAALFTLLWCPLSLLVPLAMAMLLHRVVERPGLMMGRALTRGWPAAAPGGVKRHAGSSPLATAQSRHNSAATADSPSALPYETPV